MWCLFLLLLSISNAYSNPLPQGEAISRDCEQCRLTVNLLEKRFGDDIAECTADILVFLCISFEVESNYICRAGMSNFQDEILYVLDTVLVTPKQLCSLIIDDCGTFFDPLNATWHLPMPGTKPPVQPKTVPTNGKQQSKVLQLTDLHMDMDYVVGSEAQCSNSMALCCRPQNDPNEVSMLDDIKQPAGYWGTIGQCDAPYWFVDNMLQQLAEKHTDLAYIILTGDLESHAIWDYTKEMHAQRIQNVSRLIKQHFPKTPVYFAIGNHEGVPMDSFAPHFAPSQFNMTWLYGTMADSWSDSIPQDQMETVRYNGCFMKKVMPGLRLISLNNGYGDNLNFYLMVNQTDPDGSMSWFINQLDAAEKAGDKVHVVAHIPGGTPEGLEGFSLNYYRAIIRYENTIAGQFYGHVHSEQVYMFYEDPDDATSRPVEVVYSAPSVTAYSRYNPAYKVYTIDGPYDGATYRVVDWEEHFFNLTENNQPPMTPTWKQLYTSVVQEYGLKENSPAEWSNLINRMKIDDKLFNTFMKNFFRRSDYPECDSKCRLEHLCAMRKSHHSDGLCADLEGATGKLEPDHPPRPKGNTTPEQRTMKYQKYKSGRADDKCSI